VTRTAEHSDAAGVEGEDGEPRGGPQRAGLGRWPEQRRGSKRSEGCVVGDHAGPFRDDGHRSFTGFVGAACRLGRCHGGLWSPVLAWFAAARISIALSPEPEWGRPPSRRGVYPTRTWSSELHRRWNCDKKADPDLAWWSSNSKCVYQEAFRDLDRALHDYIKSVKGERSGRRLGFPKPKKRGRCRDSFRFSTGAMRCAGSAVTLPRLGKITTHESTRKLARRLDNGTAGILSATVSRTAQRWHVAFQVEVQRTIPAHHPHPGSAIGVDLGVTTLLTGMDDRGRW